MTEEEVRDTLLQSLEGIRATAKKLENDLVELQSTVRFDPRSPGARGRMQQLETELDNLGAALRQFSEHFEEEQKRPGAGDDKGQSRVE